jgi:uncharacterized protein (TIGR02246 family)
MATTVQRAEDAVRALPHRLVAAMNARDLDAIMSVYVPDETLFVFDTMPPRQFIGAAAYRTAFEGLLGTYSGPTTYSVVDLSVTADEQLGFAHYVVHMVGTTASGRVDEMNFRLTSCARNIDGRWLIVHEHVSFPVDLATGKADFLAKP